MSKNNNDIEEIIIKAKSITIKDEITEKGEKILESHDFFRDLSEIMENEKFNNFFEKYFCNMTETKITVVYMKLYKEFKDKWKEINDKELDKRINIFLLWRMMKDKDINKFALHTVLDHLENPKKVNIFEEFQDFLKKEMKSLKE
jgi:Glu-tRNA(Gln) amidotransferase subunit E-like FAD-binding protein